MDRVEPHITIVPPFDLADPVENKGWWQQQIDQMGELSSFSIQLGQPAYFGRRVLFLSVHDVTGESGIAVHEQALYRLRERAQAYVRDHLKVDETRREDFHPHLTLAMQSFGTSLEDMRRLEQDANDLVEELPNFRVTSLRIYVLENRRWQRLIDAGFTDAKEKAQLK